MICKPCAAGGDLAAEWRSAVKVAPYRRTKARKAAEALHKRCDGCPCAHVVRLP